MDKKMEVFTAKEVSALLKLGINQTYKLMKSEGFPSYHIGNKVFVTKEALEKWLREAKNKKFII
jgi:excisionase family DNA binding protein